MGVRRPQENLSEKVDNLMRQQDRSQTLLHIPNITLIPVIRKYFEIACILSRAGFCKLVLLSSLTKEKYHGSSSQEQVTDEETPAEEGLGLKMPKVPGSPEDVDKVASSSFPSSSSSSSCGQDDNVRMCKR